MTFRERLNLGCAGALTGYAWQIVGFSELNIFNELNKDFTHLRKVSAYWNSTSVLESSSSLESPTFGLLLKRNYVVTNIRTYRK